MNDPILLNGYLLSQQKNEELKQVLTQYPKISLATILVGDDKASHIYINAKIKACHNVGITPISLFLSKDITKQELLKKIEELNEDSSIHGILVQLPLPSHLDSYHILAAIKPQKDVDCFHPFNIGNLYAGVSDFAPATSTGILMLLDSIKEQWNLESKNAVIVGASNIVGKPTAMLLLQKNATITIAHKKTNNLKELCLTADLIVVAAGKINLITEDMVKQGAVVIDVGMNRIQHGEHSILVGDVDFENAKKKSFAITPVPKGVGPMTISALLYNLYFLYNKYHSKNNNDLR